jgi:hypothetical protein
MYSQDNDVHKLSDNLYIPALRNSSVLNMDNATGQNTPAKVPKVRWLDLAVCCVPLAPGTMYPADWDSCHTKRVLGDDCPDNNGVCSSSSIKEHICDSFVVPDGIEFIICISLGDAEIWNMICILIKCYLSVLRDTF